MSGFFPGISGFFFLPVLNVVTQRQANWFKSANFAMIWSKLHVFPISSPNSMLRVWKPFCRLEASGYEDKLDLNIVGNEWPPFRGNGKPFGTTKVPNHISEPRIIAPILVLHLGEHQGEGPVIFNLGLLVIKQISYFRFTIQFLFEIIPQFHE